MHNRWLHGWSISLVWLLTGSLLAIAQGTIVSEGVTVVGADAWHIAGYRGAGTRVAIWDAGFAAYELYLGSELPGRARLTTKALGMESTADAPLGISAHGTAVAELVHDFAPEAEFFLLATGESVDYDDVLAELLAWEPDVVLAMVFGGVACFEAGASDYESVLQGLWERGILVVGPAGNDGESHWTGTFVDANGDAFHDFRDYDEEMSIAVYQGDSLHLRLYWDDPCVTGGGYELLLLDRWMSPLASSVVTDEHFPGVASIDLEGLPTGTYFLKIHKEPGAPPAQLSIHWINGRRLEYSVQAGSVGRLLPGSSRYALTVGAINWFTRWLEPYSAQGPTRDGRIKPDLVGPTYVQTALTGPAFELRGRWIGGFDGTSPAAAQVAGVALLVWQRFPDFTRDDVVDYLEVHAADLGASGKDNEYGAGLVTLPPVED
ncbi:MAG: S8 family serine peptidase [Candidatus Bipolaricaulota bacterium]|nr:MAG: S8 family serine peptidase [Candidatus Bipolaricaulota bacterium]